MRISTFKGSYGIKSTNLVDKSKYPYEPEKLIIDTFRQINPRYEIANPGWFIHNIFLNTSFAGQVPTNYPSGIY